MSSCQMWSIFNTLSATALGVGVVGFAVLGLTLIANLLITRGRGGPLKMTPAG